MRVIVTLLLAMLPFIGIGLLLWKGPKSILATRYRLAIERREAVAAQVELLRLELEDEDTKLIDKQRTLRERLGVIETRSGVGVGAGLDGAARQGVSERDDNYEQRLGADGRQTHVAR